jgi:hypothetical protein
MPLLRDWKVSKDTRNTASDSKTESIRAKAEKATAAHAR